MIKKFLLLAAVAASIFGCSGSDTVAADDGHVASGVKKGTMTDPRDGQVYKTVKIGTQTWMAENLNYPTDNGYCYGGDPANCQKYGRLYTWSAAMNACPTGWHLPSWFEFETLLSNVGTDSWERSNNLRSTGWGNGADRYGFSALPVGYYSNGKKFSSLGKFTYFWASTERSIESAYYLNVDGYYADVGSNANDYGYSVRCLQDSNEGSVASSSSSQAKPSSSSSVVKDGSEYAPSTKTLTDLRDGQVYKTVKIGSQTWMAENLNYPTYGSYCPFDDPVSCQANGRFYTWSAAMNACPTGWHLPSSEEFETLLSNVGADDKERSNNLRSTGWGNGADRYGFSALPVGYDGYNAGKGAYFWASTDYGSKVAYRLRITDYANVNFDVKNLGYTVRCLQDSNEGGVASSSSSSSVVKDGSEYDPSTKTLTDLRDGQVYKTVKIGSQTWMAENLNYPTYDSYCYYGDPANCQKYGRFYTWSAAMNACPTGWHLPGLFEFVTLRNNVGADDKERSNNLRSTGWGNGADRYGFSALPAGDYLSNDEKFYNLGVGTYFWASTEYNSGYAYSLRIRDNSADVYNFDKRDGLSVRCLQD